MPHSLVLNLLPQSPIPPQYLTGRHLHALFLTLVSSVDSTLGDRLHDSTADKAFTLSPLQIRGQGIGDRGQDRGKYKSKISTSSSLQCSHQQPIPAGTLQISWAIGMTRSGAAIPNGTRRFQGATEEIVRSSREDSLGKEFGHEYHRNCG